MPAPSIRGMNYSMNMQELYEKTIPLKEGREMTHYWWIERRSKRGKGWVIVRDFCGTKPETAEFFCKHFRDGNHRLRHLLKYGAAGRLRQS